MAAAKPTDAECLEVLVHLDDLITDADQFIPQPWIGRSVLAAPDMKHLGRRGVAAILRHLEAEGYVERSPYRKEPAWQLTVMRGLWAVGELRYPKPEPKT